MAVKIWNILQIGAIETKSSITIPLFRTGIQKHLCTKDNLGTSVLRIIQGNLRIKDNSGISVLRTSQGASVLRTTQRNLCIKDNSEEPLH